jgi:hypothetical protein
VSFNLQEVCNDPDLAEAFIILRQPGQQGAGGWQTSQPQEIPAFGVVTVATHKALQMLPEADRINAERMFLCESPMYVTSETQGITSDILLWGGLKWRVMAVGIYDNRGGYYCAVATRMRGN